MRRKYKYQLNKINWYYEEEKVIPIDQMEELICWYEENGIPATQKKDRSLWLEDNTYMVEKVGYWYRLYVHKDRKNIKYSSNWFDDTRNIPLTKSSKRVENQGTEANKVETSLFLEYNGVTPREAFGYAEQELLRCVPKQFYYINERYKDKNLNVTGMVLHKDQFKNSNDFNLTLAAQNAAGRSYSIEIDIPADKVEIVNKAEEGKYISVQGTCVGIVKQDNPTTVSVQIKADKINQ